MNKCPRCGSIIPDEASFCPECGLKLEQSYKCPSCGAKVAETDKFCMHCGTILPSVQAPSSSTNFAPNNASFSNPSTTHSSAPVSDYKTRSQRAKIMAGKMQCPACGAEISDMNNVCPECGCRIQRTMLNNSIETDIYLDEITTPKHKNKIIVIGVLVIIIMLAVLTYFLSNKFSNSSFENKAIEQVDTEQNMYDTNATGIEDAETPSDTDFDAETNEDSNMNEDDFSNPNEQATE